ncbi:MAG: hypothetical protein ACREGI_05095, partial [Candidatus Levyibacteriota bacterium]
TVVTDPVSGEIIAAATAERVLYDPADTRGARSLNNHHIIELTEWYTDEKHRKNGLMTAAVTHLASQVLYDYHELGSGITPFLFAVCNISTNAQNTGFAAGLTIQHEIEGQYVGQVLRQNVTVDGQLQDFACMFLPDSSRNNMYTRAAMQRALGLQN